MSVAVRFYGHACFGLFFDNGPSVCIDPYEPGSLGGTVVLEPIEETFDYVLCSHDHVDHAATTAVSADEVIDADFTTSRFSVLRHTVFHDEFGGRLRGGTTDILTVNCGSHRIVHLADIGERLTSEQIGDWNPGTIDLLIVPVGGYFTLGADGAFELVEKLRPSFVAPCHAANQGVNLPQLAESSHFNRRFSRDAVIVQNRSSWTLSSPGTTGSEPGLILLEAAQLPSGANASR